jgi:ATP-dependent Zn protease
LARFLRVMIWVSLVAVAIIVIQATMHTAGTVRQLDYSEFMSLVNQRRVASLSVDAKNTGHGALVDKTKYVVTLPADQKLYNDAALKNIPSFALQQPPSRTSGSTACSTW